MKKPAFRFPGHFCLILVFGPCSTSFAYSQATGWNKAAGGTYNYTDSGNWIDGSINGIWDSSLTLSGSQTITFDSDTTLLSGLDIGYTGSNRNLTFVSDGTAGRTLTLGGNITISPVSNNTVTVGSMIANSGLNLDLAGDRTLTISGGKQAFFHNAITGGNLVITGGSDSIGGSVTLTGSSAAATSDITVTRAASLAFDSSVSGNSGATRVQGLDLSGGSLLVLGNPGSNTTESISGSLTLSAGQINNTITLIPDGASHTRLTADTLTRGANGTALFRGTGLGSNPIADQTAGSSNLSFANGPTLVGGTLGTKTAAILPWAVVDTTATGLGTSFATYDSTHGIRVLAASEYSTTIDGTTTGHNIKLTATGSALTANGATTVNSLFVDSSSVTPGTVLNGSGSLTVTSGAVFFDIATMTGSNGSALTIAKNIDFGSTRGILGTTGSANQRRISFSGGISGTGGVMFYDTGTNVGQAAGFYLAHANSYTGDTYINGHVTLAHLNALPNASNGGRTGDVYLNGVLKLSVKDLSVQINGLWGNGTVFSEYTNSNKTLVVGDNNATSTFDGRFSGGGGSMNLAKIGAGTLTLTASDSANAGTTAVRNGTLGVVTLNSVTGGTATSSLGAPVTTLAGTIALGSGATTGTLKVTGTGETTDRVINLAGTTGGGALDQSGTGLLKFTSDLTATGGGNKTLTLQGSTTGTGEIAGAIADNSGTNKTSLMKSGSGTWILSGDNTYSGATTASGGTLVINGSLGNTTTTIQSGATLAGNGDLGGAVTVQGILAPGTSIGKLSFGSNLDLSGISNFEIDPLGLNADLADVTGAITFGGTLNVLYGGSKTSFSSGMTFNLFDASSFGGAFNTINLPDLAGTGLSWQDELLTNGSITVIPEPPAAFIGALGLLALLRRRRS